MVDNQSFRPKILMSVGVPPPGDRLTGASLNMAEALERAGADVIIVTNQHRNYRLVSSPEYEGRLIPESRKVTESPKQANARNAHLILPRNAYADLKDNDIDAIMIMGNSADISPFEYGAKINPKTKLPEDQTRRTYEMQLLRHAMEYGIPANGICYGMQLMGVALGGEMEQNLGDNPNHKQHEVDTTVHLATEDLEIVKHTPLDGMFAKAGIPTEGAQVNSAHHQALKPNDKKFTVMAWSKDKDRVVEAICAKEAMVNGEKCEIDFMGLQFHPELLNDKRLVDAYAQNIVERARGYHQQKQLPQEDQGLHVAMLNAVKKAIDPFAAAAGAAREELLLGPRQRYKLKQPDYDKKPATPGPGTGRS